MNDPTSQLRTATRRAKSDVANKLISMFLHELSRESSKHWPIRVDGAEYAEEVRKTFGNRCPYCDVALSDTTPVVEHLDGMNRYRVGLHVAGNVLISCRRCNNEKRRDDSLPQLILADSGWESFLSHDGRCGMHCKTCDYWSKILPVESERVREMATRMEKIRGFRLRFPESELMRREICESLPSLVGKLYSDCQKFAELEISSLLQLFRRAPTHEAK